MVAAEEFEELYQTSSDRIAAQLYALTGDRHGALDLVQEAFVRTWARWDRIASYDDPEAFVRRVAFNLAKSHWRRASKTVLRSSPPERSVAATDPSLHQDLVEALKTLSSNERETVVLHYLAGLSVDEIAAGMKAPRGTVKSWLSRGRSRLAVRLALDDPEEMTRNG